MIKKAPAVIPGQSALCLTVMRSVQVPLSYGAVPQCSETALSETQAILVIIIGTQS